MAVSAQGAQLRPARLLLRRWRETDLAPFAVMNADPKVMEYFSAPLARAESDAFACRIEEGFGEAGFGLWAAETPADGGFIGYTGLARPRFTAHFTSPARPATEIGWRLARHAWGHGYATEAARAVLGFAFDCAGLSDIVSFTAVTMPAPRPRCGASARPTTPPMTSTTRPCHQVIRRASRPLPDNPAGLASQREVNPRIATALPPAKRPLLSISEDKMRRSPVTIRDQRSS